MKFRFALYSPLVIRYNILSCRGEFRDVVAGAGACGQQLALTAAEAGEGGFGPGGVGIGDLIALI